MKKTAVILIAEDNQTNFELITRNLQRAGITNEVQHLTDGRQTLDFIFENVNGPMHQHNKEYILLLNTDITNVDGTEVLRKLKQDSELKKIPVIALTKNDDPSKIELCNDLGCSICIVQPSDSESFAETIKKIGLFLAVVELPQINSNGRNQGQA